MRNVSRWFGFATAVSAAMVLAACGGGGGGGGGTPAVGDAPCASIGTGTMVLSGTARFESVANNTTNGGLVYSTVNTSPMRGLSVQAVCGSTVLATATSSASGAYSMTVPKNTAVSIKVLAEIVQTTGPANWKVQVRDNTDGNALWAVQNTATNTGTGTTAVSNITAPLGWTGASYGVLRASGPFAILDTVYTGFQKVITANASAQFPLLSMYWSPKNRPSAANNLALGELTSAFFVQSGTGAAAVRSIYLMGAENVNTDEFDGGVVAHEFGHYLQSVFSQNHSTGGAHALGDKLDMTLAYGEGWGYAFASLARGNPLNADSSGPQQGRGFIVDTTNASPPNKGWFNEDSVQHVIYTLGIGQGFGPIWAAFSGPMSGGATGQKSLNTIFSFAAAVRSAGNGAVISAMNTLLGGQGIFTGAGADEWGAGETADGANPVNLPVYRTLTSVITPVCFTDATDPRDKANNKLSEVRYYRFTASSTGSRTIVSNSSVPGPGAHDIDLEVFKNGILQGKAIGDSTTAESYTLSVAAGDIVVVRVTDFNIITASTSTCATISVNN